MQGSKLPDGSMGPEIVKKVSLRGLQPTMTNVELDFLRLCLVLDGAERPSASELLAHPFFYPDFKWRAQIQLKEALRQDQFYRELMTHVQVRAKDGRDQIPLAEALSDLDPNSDLLEQQGLEQPPLFRTPLESQKSSRNLSLPQVFFQNIKPTSNHCDSTDQLLQNSKSFLPAKPKITTIKQRKVS